MSALAALVISVMVGMGLTPFVRRMAVGLNVLDHPNWRKVHRHPIPRMGGVAVYIAWACGLFGAMSLTSWQPDTGPLVKIAALGALVVVLGVWDDWRDVSGTAKLSVQCVIASLVFVSGLRIDRLTNPLGGEIFFPWPLNCLVTVAWVVGIMNALNLIDGLDGLAAGVAAIIAYGLMASGLYLESPYPVILLAALVGACLGFLRYNFHPASIFLGDSGSQFLGYIFAVSALVEHQYKAATAASLLLPLTAMMLPILDTGLAVIRRLRGRRSLFRADKLHLHHRLLRLGLSQRRVVIFFYLVTAYLSCFAFLFVVIREQFAVVLLVLIALGLLMAMETLRFMERKVRAQARHRMRAIRHASNQ
jgi:UDP-GlcNAc:undecaprenyl-phosphate GlcNAc-1-phosphate transferase